MKRIVLFMLVTAILFAVQILSAPSSMAASHTLTDEDLKVMLTYKTANGHYLSESDRIKDKIDPSYTSAFMFVAKDYMELRENYDFKEIATEEGKQSYITGFEKYFPYKGGAYAYETKNQIAYINENTLVKKSVFVTNEDFVFSDSINHTAVIRGIFYFTILEGKDDALAKEKVKKGVEYKVIADVYPNAWVDRSDPSTYQVSLAQMISDPVVATSPIPIYAAPTAVPEVPKNVENVSVNMTLAEMPNLKEVKSYADYNVAIRNNGTVLAWGNNNDGQCLVPEDLTGVKAIASSGYHTVALKEDGNVVAWGNNNNGQCNVPKGLARVKAVATGNYFTVALKEDGTITAWGENYYGQCDVPEGLTDVKEIKTGADYTLALKEDGTVVGWGKPGSGLLDIPAGLKDVKAIEAGFVNAAAIKKDGTLVVWGSNAYKQWDVPKGLSGVKAVLFGYFNVLALTENGTVAAWGDNSFGQSSVPAELPKIKGIATGGTYTIALKEDGTIVSWGLPGYVPANLPHIKEIYVQHAVKEDGTVIIWGDKSCAYYKVMEGSPKPVYVTAGTYPADFNAQLTGVLKEDGTVVVWGSSEKVLSDFPGGITNVRQIAAGCYFTLALKNDGTVTAWGVNHRGTRNLPKGLAGVKAIAAGDHAVALKNDGTVVSWGELAEKIPKGLSNVEDIAAGVFHTVALKTDGTVAVWGDKSHGQCDVPKGLTGVKAIAAGDYYTVALKKDGTVVAWGENDEGQCNVPKNLAGVKAIATGSEHTVALKEDGTVVIWGANRFNTELLKIPQWLSNQKVKAVGAGKGLSFVILENGVIAGWGDFQTDSFYLPRFLPVYSTIPASSKVMVNNQTISFEAYSIHGNNYFKLRDLAMAVNGTEKQFEVSWDGTKKAINLITNKTYTATGGELVPSENPKTKEAIMTSSKVYVNGKEASLAAYTIGGSNYFKLRDIAKLMDFSVEWDEGTSTIRIDTSGSYTD